MSPFASVLIVFLLGATDFAYGNTGACQARLSECEFTFTCEHTDGRHPTPDCLKTALEHDDCKGETDLQDKLKNLYAVASTICETKGYEAAEQIACWNPFKVCAPKLKLPVIYEDCNVGKKDFDIGCRPGDNEPKCERSISEQILNTLFKDCKPKEMEMCMARIEACNAAFSCADFGGKCYIKALSSEECENSNVLLPKIGNLVVARNALCSNSASSKDKNDCWPVLKRCTFNVVREVGSEGCGPLMTNITGECKLKDDETCKPNIITDVANYFEKQCISLEDTQCQIEYSRCQIGFSCTKGAYQTTSQCFDDLIKSKMCAGNPLLDQMKNLKKTADRICGETGSTDLAKAECWSSLKTCTAQIPNPVIYEDCSKAREDLVKTCKAEAPNYGCSPAIQTVVLNSFFADCTPADVTACKVKMDFCTTGFECTGDNPTQKCLKEAIASDQCKYADVLKRQMTNIATSAKIVCDTPSPNSACYEKLKSCTKDIIFIKEADTCSQLKADVMKKCKPEEDKDCKDVIIKASEEFHDDCTTDEEQYCGFDYNRCIATAVVCEGDSAGTTTFQCLDVVSQLSGCRESGKYQDRMTNLKNLAKALCSSKNADASKEQRNECWASLKTCTEGLPNDFIGDTKAELVEHLIDTCTGKCDIKNKAIGEFVMVHGQACSDSCKVDTVKPQCDKKTGPRKCLQDKSTYCPVTQFAVETYCDKDLATVYANMAQCDWSDYLFGMKKVNDARGKKSEDACSQKAQADKDWSNESCNDLKAEVLKKVFDCNSAAGLSAIHLVYLAIMLLITRF